MRDLFYFDQERNKENLLKPLSDKLRPEYIQDIIGQEHITDKTGPINNIIKNNNLSSIIFWGPPGTGKTSLARIIPRQLKKIIFMKLVLFPQELLI